MKVKVLIKHLIIIIMLIVTLLPIWLVISVSGSTNADALQSPPPLYPHFGLLFKHLYFMLFKSSGVLPPYYHLMLNSFIMACGIAMGKIILALLSSYAIVYFKLPFKNWFFVIIFFTLMLPIEVRLITTYSVSVNLHILNSYSGLILPVIASATATLFFRQFFLTIPIELLEAARLDNAGFVRFFFTILLPLSKTNIAAIFVIMFLYGWNQYLWPLLITSDPKFFTVVMSLEQVSVSLQDQPVWWQAMSGTLLSMLPSVLVMLFMQQFFVKGLMQKEK